jgi:hypothetical protein
MTATSAETKTRPGTSARPATRVSAAGVSFPLVALLGYVAFLIAGFGTGLQAWRPIPLYVFFGVLIFLFQARLIQTRSVARLIYTALASIFALLYAADVAFNTSGTWHFTRAPLTYIVINFLLFAVLIYDAVARRRDGSGRLTPATLATDFAELAILSYVAATLVNLLRAGHPPYVVIDLNQTLGLHLPARIHTLQDFDSALALAATALTLLFLGIVGGSAQAPAAGRAEGSFAETLARIGQTTLREVSVSLRLVLGPLIYVSAALASAYLARQITQFFASAQQSPEVFDLLNPFSPMSVARYQQGLVTLGLTGVSVAATVLSVALVEQNLRVIRESLRVVARAGQTMALTLAFFIFSLAFLNAVLIFVGLTKLEPFQVSAFALLALGAAGVLAGYHAWRRGPDARAGA